VASVSAARAKNVAKAGSRKSAANASRAEPHATPELPFLVESSGKSQLNCQKLSSASLTRPKLKKKNLAI